MKNLLAIAILDVIIVFVGVLLTEIRDSLAYMSGALSLMAVITFFGVLIKLDSAGDTVMRNAIAISVISVYLVLVVVITFYSGDLKSTDITNTILVSFVIIKGFQKTEIYCQMKFPKN